MDKTVLTPAQAAAVQARGSAVLVSAAAGSGKTKVLVERLLTHVCDAQSPCDIDDFLLITFTKKAAAEMRARILRELSARLAEAPENKHLQRQMSRIYLAQISTIHAFCAQLLRQYAYALDIPADFRVLEQTESRQLRERVMAQLLERRYADIANDGALQALVDTLGAGRDDRVVAELAERLYNTVQCHIYPADWTAQCVRTLDMTQYGDLSETPWGAYLLDDFREFLALQEQNMQLAHTFACDGGELQKKVAPLLAENLGVLHALQASRTWDEIYEQRTFSFGTLRIPKNCDEEVCERIKALRSACAKSLRDRLRDFDTASAQAMLELFQSAKALKGLFALTEEFSRAYRAEKLRLHALDYGDLEHDAVRLLLRTDGTPTAAAREISERFRQIMVDEYQDTNEVQDRIFKAISQDGRNRFMVGDVKQSIYRFRLADPGIFLDKYKRYPDYTVAPEGAPRKILLSENFRSGEAILDAANAVFSACMSERVGGLVYGEQEMLRLGRPHPELPYPPVELHCINTKTDEATLDRADAEARFVAQRIRRLLDEQTPVTDGDGLRPVRPSDIVILLRALKGSAGAYLAALRALAIPCSCESSENVLDSQELESLLSLLQVLDNAHQDVPLAAVMLSPLFGFSGQELAQMRADSRQTDLLDAVTAAREKNGKAAAFLDTLDDLRDTAQQQPLHVLVEQINEKTGFEAVCGAMPDGTARQANLRWFSAYVASFEEGGKKSLHQLLARVETEREQGVSAGVAEASDAVQIMSIHKSKGLEFPVVILANLAKKFNMNDLSEPVLLHPTLGAGSNVYDADTRVQFPSVAKHAIARKLEQESRSEELRVLYVAMTRAQDMLIMTYCASNLQKTLTELATLPDNPLVSSGAGCAGAWVLQTAMRRTEAGELFAFAGQPDETKVSRIPWRICLQQACPEEEENTVDATVAQTAKLPYSAQALREALEFQYAAAAASTVPSKLTATQLKGRALDEESADGSVKAPPPVHLEKPVFSETEQALTPAQKGTATHLAMQYLDFSKTNTLAELDGELKRMEREKFLTPQQAAAVQPERLLRVFRGELGARIRAAQRIVREFKFSVLTDAGAYAPEAVGEQLMLQGVADLCLVDEDALSVVDFKTDRIKPGGDAQAAAYYRGQLEAYSRALSEIFQRPVKSRLLYFFQTDTLIEV